MSSPYADAVEKACQDHIPGILFELVPEGHVSGHRYLAGTIHGGAGDSFSFEMGSGDKQGLWADFASGEKGGKGIIALYARVKGIDWKDALRDLAQRFGIERPKRATSDERDWMLVSPVPIEAYQCSDEDMSPLVPSGALQGQPDASWAYLNEQFELLFFVTRFNPGPKRKKKDFYPLTFWRHKDGYTAWRIKEFTTPRPLFNLENWSEEIKQVLIMEGEKCAMSARRLLPDYWSTCWPGGASAVNYADWNPVRRLIAKGAKVLLWPDKGTSGESAMTAVGKQLACPLEVLTPDPRWPAEYDIADLERDKWTSEQVREFIASHTISVSPEPPPERINVLLEGSDTYSHAQAVWQAIPQTKAPLYNAAPGIVRVKKSIFGQIQLDYLDRMTVKAFLLPYVRLRKHHSTHGLVDTTMSDLLAESLVFDCNGYVPPLEGVQHTPIFLPSGQLIDQTGYNREARVWLQIPEGYDRGMPVEEARETWADFIADWPWASDADKCHATAYPIAALIRRRITGPTLLWRFEAPQSRTGKSLLCSVLSSLLTPMPGIISPSDSDEELEKSITSNLLDFPTVTILDNVKKLESRHWAAVLTGTVWKKRILGQSKDVCIPITTLFAATLNNPQFSRDMFARTIRVRIDAKCSHPERRPALQFRHPHILKYALENKGLLLSALVSMVAEGLKHKNAKLPALGGYEGFISELAPIMEANGFRDFLNIPSDAEEAGASEGEGLEDFIHNWHSEFGASWVKVSDLLNAAQNSPGLPLKRMSGGGITSESLGWFLRKNRQVVIDGVTITGPKRMYSRTHYCLTGDPDWEVEKNESLNVNSGLFENEV
jgi:hypothetical protein